MKIFSKKLCFPLIAIALLLGGCPKTPNRPDPSATILGPGPGNMGLNPLGFDVAGDPGSTLEMRDGLYEDANTIRGLLQAVYFDFDKSAIRPAERDKLADAASYLSQNPNQRLLVEGHCDWRGTTEYNLGLGDRRAASVKSYLQTLGIDPGRIETLSKGDLDATETSSEQQLQHDRRAELVILK